MKASPKSDFQYFADTGLRVRDGLFSAASRTYAEQYVEPLIRAKYGLQDPESNDHDAIGNDGTTYEIKACKVLRTSDNRLGTRSLLERILYENTNMPTNRLIPFENRLNEEYDANVQNVKRDHFDILIYALLFEDAIQVFQARADDIATGTFRGWSDKHGRYDALGKSGQFSVNKRTVEWHVANHLTDTITYMKAAEIYSKI